MDNAIWVMPTHIIAAAGMEAIKIWINCIWKRSLISTGTTLKIFIWPKNRDVQKKEKMEWKYILMYICHHVS